MANHYSEDRHVQETTAKYLVDNLDWNEMIYAFSGTLGRASEKEIVLAKFLRPALERLNPNLPASAYEQAILRFSSLPTATISTRRFTKLTTAAESSITKPIDAAPLRVRIC